MAVIGAGGFGSRMLRALTASRLVEVVGLSDRSPETAERVGRTAGLPAYHDNRRLLAETRPAAVFAAVPPAAGPDVVALCAEHGVHLWKELPLGRNLTEAAGLVERMNRAGMKFAVAAQRRFAPGYRTAWRLREELGHIFLARAHYMFNWGPQLGWRADRESAGGGALLELGWHPVDLLVWMLGLPEEVYGLNTISPPRQDSPGRGPLEPARPYDTDDAAAGILRYQHGCMATVVTTRRSGPVSEGLSLHGPKGSLTADGDSCILRDPDGGIIDEAAERPAEHVPFIRQVEAFASAVLSGAEKYECSAAENLLVQATIEAMYLSGRTGQPESPARLLGTHGLTVRQCLALRPEGEEHITPAGK
ncbi:MAG: Gfo/Idh/MocA family oxidoreductase [Planctomycetes bacterium]|nr:Gfo/Idh/MocA family oxidoreductase [Planctomycetota bacterium]